MTRHAFEDAPVLMTQTEPIATPIRSIGFDEAWDMPVAEWITSHMINVPEFLAPEHAVVMHRGGTPVERRIGRKVLPARAHAIGIQGAGYGYLWHAEGPLACAHLYFKPDLVIRVVAETTGRSSDGMLRDMGAMVEDRRLTVMTRDYLDRATDSRLPPSALEMDARALLIVLHVAATYGAPDAAAPDPGQRTAPLPSWRLKRVQDYIEAHLDQPIRLEHLAAIAGQSAYHFSRAFKAATGIGPHRYLQERRIARASELIAARDMPISEVALACGFANQAHFTTAFKMATGTTPGRFRREAAG